MAIYEPIVSLRDEGPATFTPEQLYRGTTSVFGQGLRSGMSGIGSNLNQIVGLGGEALGADEFAQDQYQEAQRLRMQAEAQAPVMNEFGKAKSLRDYGDYAAGMAGQLAPMLGGALAGGALMGPIAGGIATMAPIEAGDIAYRQQMDPESANLGAGERLGRAALGGLASGAAQTVLPAGIAAKMGAKGLGGALALRGEGSFGRAMLGNVAEGAATNYAGAGVGELAKQQATNGNKDWDLGAANEMGLAGAVIGGAAHVPVGLASYAKGKGISAGETMGDIKEWGSKALTKAGDAIGQKADEVAESPTGQKINSLMDDAGEALGKAKVWGSKKLAEAGEAVKEFPESDMGKKASNLFDKAGEMLSRGKEAAEDIGGKIVRGEPIVEDLKGFASASGDRLKEMMDVSDSKAAQWVKETGEDLLTKFKEGDPRREKVMEAMSEGAGRAGHVAMEGLKTAYETSKTVGKKLGDMAEAFGANVSESEAASQFGNLGEMFGDAVKRHMPGGGKPKAAKEAKAAPTPEMRDAFIAEQMAAGKTKREAMQAFTASTIKESRDYSGAETAILGAIKESGLAKKQPDLFTNENIGKTAKTMRMMLDKMSNGKLNLKQMVTAARLFGDDTNAVIHSLKKVLGDKLSPEVENNFFTNLNKVEEIAQRNDSVHRKLWALMPEGIRPKLGTKDAINEIVDLGTAHAQGTLLSESGRANRPAAEVSAAEIATNRRVKELFIQRFGANADKALDIIGKHAKMEAKDERVGSPAFSHVDEYGNMVESDQAAMEGSKEGPPQAAPVERITFGLTKPDRAGNSKSEINGRPMTQDDKYTPRHLQELQEKYPDYRVTWQKSDDPRHAGTGLGHIVAERLYNPEGLEVHDVASMALDMKNRSRSPDRIEFPENDKAPVVDSWKVAHTMHGRLERGALDNLSTEQRMARMFIEGIARLTERYGEPKIDDKVRIARINGKDMTWGDAKKLDARTEVEKGYDRNTQQMDAARKELSKLGDGEENSAKRYELEKTIRDIEDMREFEKNKELTKNGEVVGRSFDQSELPKPLDAEGRPVSAVRSRADDSVPMKKGPNPNGESVPIDETQQPDPKGNIHELTRRMGKGKDTPLFADAADPRLDKGPKRGAQLMRDTTDTRPVDDMVIKANMAGDPHFVSDKTDFTTSMQAAARDIARGGTVMQQRAGKRLERLSRPDINLSRLDRDKLGAVLMAELKPHDKVRIINEVAANYKEAMAKRGPQKPGTVIEGKNRGEPEAEYYEGVPFEGDYDSLPTVPLGEVPKRGPNESPLPGEGFDSPESPLVNGPQDMADRQARYGSKQPPEAPPIGDAVPTVRTSEKATMLENATIARVKALTPTSAAAHEAWATKELSSTRVKNGNDVLALNQLISKAQELQGKPGSAPNPKALPPEQGGASGNVGVKLTGGIHVGKDNVKSQQATKFIGRGSEASSTASYAKQWGDRANTGEYTAQDRVFVSAEGARNGRVDPDSIEIGKAVKAGATILTDSMTTGRERSYNVGERQVAAILTEKGYVEAKPGEWTPSPEIAAKKTAFVERAAAGDETLINEVKSSTDVKGLLRAAEALHSAGEERVVPESYRERARAYIGKVLGDNVVDLVFSSEKLKELGAGGSYGLRNGRETITLRDKTPHGLRDEGGVLLHESAHALFARLMTDKKFTGSAEALVRVSQSEAIQKQFAQLHADDAGRLHYIKNNPEEAVAYMYQHWADGTLKITDKPTLTVFEKVRAFLGKFLNSLSDEQHAETLFKFFKDGKLKDEFSPVNADSISKAQKMSRDRDYIKYNHTAEMINDRIAELMGSGDDDGAYAAYAAQTERYSFGTTNPQTRTGQPVRDSVEAHIKKVLGDTVKVFWESILAAGSYTHELGKGAIRLSVHALDPMGTAYHESLHGFFAQLREAGHSDITRVLEKTAKSEHVLAQLREIYKGSPDVLKQLENHEERAAYMYQQWALDPKGFKIEAEAKTVFQKIAKFIHSVMGTWTNDQRALHIMEYFNSGEYIKNRNAPNAVRYNTMDVKRNQILETAKSFTEPLGKLADAMVGTGAGRLRDMDIDAITEIADRIKRPGTQEGGDTGFIPAARAATSKRVSELGKVLGTMDAAVHRAALEALQTGKPGGTPEVQKIVRDLKDVLQDTKDYMTGAGVKMGDLGPNYFPRVWDTSYIAKNQKAFRDMLEPYIRSGMMKGTAEGLIRNLISRNGNEFGIESREPGMQFTKHRDLDFLDPKDVAPFLNKDLASTMVSYISQAARKAEWTRRLGDDRLEGLMAQAKEEGATDAQLKVVDDYLKGVDGTLGDSMNPQARRVIGNMIVYQNIRLLPLASFSMLIDPNGVMVRGGTVGEAWGTFKRGIREIKGNLGKGAAPDEAARIAELVGVVDSAMMQSVMGDLYTQGMVGGTAKNINDKFFKYNLVEGLNRSFHIGATEAAMNFMARHADLTHSTHSKRWMAELGIKQGDIKTTKDGRIALTVQEGLRPEQVDRVHAAINQWVDGAILRPDAADKPIWMNDPRFALIAHLKQFVFAFQETILKRTIHEVRNGNYQPMMAMASYLPIMIAADMAKGALVSGGGTPDWQEGWTVADYVSYGSQRAGFWGVGQFGIDVAKDFHRGGTGIGALAGPTIEQFGDALNTIGGKKHFGSTMVHALPANALYSNYIGRPTPEMLQHE